MLRRYERVTQYRLSKVTHTGNMIWRRAREREAIIGIGGSVSCSPATPPGMRVRTGRFEKLRSSETREAKAVEVFDGEHWIQAGLAIVPAATCAASTQRGPLMGSTQCPETAVNSLPGAPVLELNGPKSVAYP